MTRSSLGTLVALPDLKFEAGLGGLLLCGGRSQRMGFDKSQLVVEGEQNLQRLASLLSRYCAPAIALGEILCSIPMLKDEHPGAGPLAALAGGWRYLREQGATGAVVLACDLPLITEQVLDLLVRWPSPRSVVPVLGSEPQPLCARWSARDLDRAVDLVLLGSRSMRDLLAVCDAEFVDEEVWSQRFPSSALMDVDTVEDLERLGLTWARSLVQ